MSAHLTEFIKRLESFAPVEVTIGMAGVELFPPAAIPGEQVGYAHSPGGEDLCGNRPGDWQRSWVVFGRETLCGDPLFVDADDPQFPVFTAMHGEGSWEPNLVSDSFAAFAATMQEMSRLSSGRQDSELEENPLSPAERKSLVKTLRRLSPSAAPDFWLGLFEVE
jgi:hypothetical protein